MTNQPEMTVKAAIAEIAAAIYAGNPVPGTRADLQEQITLAIQGSIREALAGKPAYVEGWRDYPKSEPRTVVGCNYDDRMTPHAAHPVAPAPSPEAVVLGKVREWAVRNILGSQTGGCLLDFIDRELEAERAKR